jgi:hypothetical protein
MTRLGDWMDAAEAMYRDHVPAHLREGLAIKYAAFRKYAATVNAKIAKVLADATLSAEGKALALKAIGTEADADLGKLEAATWGVLDGRVRDGEAALLAKVQIKAPSDPAERIAYEMRNARIVDKWERFDTLTRDAAYKAENDPTILDALESASKVLVQIGGGMPRSQPLISAEVVQARRLERARAADPVAVAEIAELRTMADTYRSISALLRNEIRTAIPEARISEPMATNRTGGFTDPRTGEPITLPTADAVAT